MSMSLSVGAEGTGMLDWFVEQTLVYEDLYAMGTVDSWLAKDNNNQYGIIDNYGTVVYPFDTYSNMEHEPRQGKSPDIF